MAVMLKRKRGAVSYREPSSDDDFSDSGSENVSRKKRLVPTRRSARHHVQKEQEPSPRPDYRNTSLDEGTAPDQSRSLRRRPRRKISYRESSDDDADEDFEPEGPSEPKRPFVKVAQSPRPSKRKEASKAIGRPSSDKSRLRFGAPRKRRAGPSTSSIPTPIATDGHIPAWASLPYHVLLQIFVYAYHSLRDENTEPTAATSWLVRVARMCRAFTKPALTALYRNPPISAMTHNRKDLVEHLVQPPADAHEDYQVMVKRLELDAAQMASTTDPIHSATDLAALITALTTVREIDIFDPLDRPPYRERSKRMRRWTYPDELFDALRRANLRLRSWRWRSSFCAHGPLWMKEIHDDKSFQSLREVTLTKFDPEESRKPDETKTTVEELLGSALAVLPNLKSLVFESCKVVNGSLLPLLPKTLLSLNITNCFNLTSDALEAFLAESGQNLEDLVLNHNQCLDLSFLVSLKQSCPQLEVLRMDLNYYSSLMMSSDNEPLYDFLLGEDEIPTWPSTLKVIDMEYLRHWSSNAATNFFTSIIDSADELPRLRELQILAMVDVGWRQRADFRRKWAARFERVFARRCSAPSPHLASLRAYREWKTSHPDVKNDSLLDISEEMKNNDNDESDSDVPLVPNSCQKRDEVWGSRRLRTRGKASANYDETSEAEATSDASGGDAGEEPRVIQGQCHTVMVRIDNGRPREEVFDENDFLDPEPSGDEDWNSEVDEVNGWGADSTVAW